MSAVSEKVTNTLVAVGASVVVVSVGVEVSLVTSVGREVSLVTSVGKLVSLVASVGELVSLVASVGELVSLVASVGEVVSEVLAGVLKVVIGESTGVVVAYSEVLS